MCGSFIGGISTTSPCSNSTRPSPKTPASMARWYSSRVQWWGAGASMGRAVVVDMSSVVLITAGIAARCMFVELVDQMVKLVFGRHLPLHHPISTWPGFVCGRAWSHKGREDGRSACTRASQHSITLIGGHDHRAMAQEAVGCGLVSSGTATWLEASPKQAASLAECCVRAAATRFAGVAIRARCTTAESPSVVQYQ